MMGCIQGKLDGVEFELIQVNLKSKFLIILVRLNFYEILLYIVYVIFMIYRNFWIEGSKGV